MYGFKSANRTKPFFVHKSGICALDSCQRPFNIPQADPKRIYHSKECCDKASRIRLKKEREEWKRKRSLKA